jgi:hypothetical protein
VAAGHGLEAIEQVIHRGELAARELEFTPRQITALDGARERFTEIFAPQGLERVVARAHQGHGGERTDHLEQERNLLVARPEHVTRAANEPLAGEGPHDGFGPALGPMVIGRPAIGAQRRNVNEAAHPSPLGLGHQVAGALDVDALEG